MDNLYKPITTGLPVVSVQSNNDDHQRPQSFDDLSMANVEHAKLATAAELLREAIECDQIVVLSLELLMDRLRQTKEFDELRAEFDAVVSRVIESSSLVDRARKLLPRKPATSQ